MKHLFLFAIYLIGASLVANEKPPAVSLSKPNIIIFYADDLGPGMLSCYGQALYETPNVDQLADEGMRFTNFYGNNVCAPARANLLTGRHDGHIPFNGNKGGFSIKLHNGSVSQADYDALIGIYARWFLLCAATQATADRPQARTNLLPLPGLHGPTCPALRSHHSGTG